VFEAATAFCSLPNSKSPNFSEANVNTYFDMFTPKNLLLVFLSPIPQDKYAAEGEGQGEAEALLNEFVFGVGGGGLRPLAFWSRKYR